MQQFNFHPITTKWFEKKFGEPTPTQRLGWPAIASGQDTLIAAPTGTGKTMTAFLGCFDELLRLGLDGQLTNTTHVLYVSPLKALSNDIQRNLDGPLAEIYAQASVDNLTLPEIRTAVRTGDTPASVRASMLKKPPHIVVTTPESLFLLLTASKSREILKSVKTVIIDEIHYLAKDKRGSHLALSLARLDALCQQKPVRIGLSATQKPIKDIARFLQGRSQRNGAPGPQVIDIGHQRQLDLEVLVPKTPLTAVCMHEHWDEIYDDLADHVNKHRSTVIFVNTRKLAEKIAFNLQERLGDAEVASHHGSLAKDRRLDAERRLKNGQLKAIVATASLELGIDIGYIDLVCQIGSPRNIASFLQRVGRSGHAIGKTPKGRLFALTRDELIESLAMLQAIHAGELDAITIPDAPLDILAQQIVACSTEEDWQVDDLFDLVTEAWPYRNLDRGTFNQVLTMLANGYAPNRKKYAFIHYDQINNKIRSRPSARMAAIMAGGAIPETGDFRVTLEPDKTFIGTVNEDFALESQRGDIFLLGSHSWQIQSVRGGEVQVVDAHGQPPTIPFWLGEAPGRTFELSKSVSTLRTDIFERIKTSAPLTDFPNIDDFTEPPSAYTQVIEHLTENLSTNTWALTQAIAYVASQAQAIGTIPSQTHIVFERFFDETGGMQLVIHAPLGMRVNRAFGLALRKRFCRSFNFELQASADDNGVVLSLGPQHSMPTERLFHLLNERNITAILEQAILAVPFFEIRWRWNATRSLGVLRATGGKRVPPALQRFRADDLLTAIFPVQTACQENVTGDIELPNHPLVQLTMHDCMTEAMDVNRLKEILRAIEAGQITLQAVDTRAPSPFSQQLLNANPYAFLDDAPLEERRTRAVMGSPTSLLGKPGNLAELDPRAITQVAQETKPLVRNHDELHDALTQMQVLPENKAWQELFAQLKTEHRAGEFVLGDTKMWCATETISAAQAAYQLADKSLQNLLTFAPKEFQDDLDQLQAVKKIVQGHLEYQSITDVQTLAALLKIPENLINTALELIEVEGHVVRGRFHTTAARADKLQWCDRRALARIHRLTIDGLRAQIKPVSVDHYMGYLFAHHGIDDNSDGNALIDVLSQLQGFESPCGAWETEILPTRLKYQPYELDQLTFSGQVTWGRARQSKDREVLSNTPGMNRNIPIVFCHRQAESWIYPDPDDQGEANNNVANLSADCRTVLQTLKEKGASFYDVIKANSGLLSSQVSKALGQLLALGLVHGDGFATLRPFLIAPNKKKRVPRPRRPKPINTYAYGGRWTLTQRESATLKERRAELWAEQLLLRYGVLFRDLLKRETLAPPWRDLAAYLRLQEIRGEIRGGRFIEGVSGEQFAYPETITRLRQKPEQNKLIFISGADPLNLTSLFNGQRAPAHLRSTLAYKNGTLLAVRTGKDVIFTPDCKSMDQQQIRSLITLDQPTRMSRLENPVVLSSV